MQFSYIIVSLHIFSGYLCIQTDDATGLVTSTTHHQLEYRLAVDLNIVCTSDRYKGFKPYLVLGTFAYPVGLMCLLVCQLCTRPTTGTTELTSMQILKMSLKSIYVEQFYFWECVIMMKRLLVVSALTLLRMYTDVQLLLVMLITFLYLSFVLYARPYSKNIHNVMSFISNTTQFMVAFAGLVFYLSRKARSVTCGDTITSKSGLSVQTGGEIFMYIFLIVYFIILTIFGLYKGRHQILYIASCGCLNMLKSFQKLEGEDDEESGVPDTIEMIVEGGNQLNDSNEVIKQDRKLSVLSRQRMAKLEDLHSRFTISQTQFNSLMETLKATSDHDGKMRIKGALSQLYGELEELQNVEIDSIVVGDLQSGRKKAKEARKQLTKQVEALLVSVRNTVRQLQA